MPEPAVVTVSAAKLFMQKLLVAFIAIFLPVFIATVSPVYAEIVDTFSTGGSIDFDFLPALAISLVLGALGALGRAFLMLMPGLNLVASDKLHSLGKGDKPREVKAIGQAP